MSVAYLHLKRAIEKNNECFLCDIENELEQKYFNNYLQELVMDAKARDEIVESRGYIRPNETIEQTVVREVEEETGLKIASTKFVGLYEDFLTQGNEPINHVIGAYEAQAVGGKILFTKEAIAYKWLNAEEAQNSSQVPKVFKEIEKDIGIEHKKRFSLWRNA